MKRLVLFLALLVATVTGAQAESSDRGLALQPVGTATVAELDEYRAFARELADRLNQGDASMLNTAFDVPVFLDRALQGIPETTELGEVRRGMRQGLSQVGDILLQRLNTDYAFHFLRARERDGVMQLLYRVDLGEEGLNYFELEAVKRSGDIRVVDWYDYATAQRYTASVRQALLTLIPLDRSLLDRLLGTGDVDEEAVQAFIEMARLQRERRFDEWLARYATLPDALKHSRILVILHVFNANSSGDEQAYREALADAARHFGDDPKLGLLLVDHYMYTGQWTKAHAALESLDGYIGGDTAIDGMRANLYLLAGDHLKALDWAQRSIDGDPGYEDAYWTRLEANVHLGLFDAAVADLEVLKNQFGYSFDTGALAQIEGYEAFGRSEVFRRWARKN